MSNLEPLVCRHPILSAATLNYREGCKYSAEHRRTPDQTCTVTHTVRGEQCLVRELLLNRNAVAMCTVVAPWAMYRGTFPAEREPTRQSEGEVRVVQEISFRTPEFEPPIKMQPAIVVVDPPAPIVLGEEHGVHEVWYDAEIVFEKGAILTDHPWWENLLGESIFKVTKATESDNYVQGSYEVEPVSDKGFYFHMRVSPELYDVMHHPGSPATNAHVHSLYTAALAEGLGMLRDQYQHPENWRQYTNLRSLHTHLKQKNLHTWDEEGFSPNQSAAGLAPHVIPNRPEEESDQGELFGD